MSQIVTLKRKISTDELRQALKKIDSLSMDEEHDWGFTIEYELDSTSLVTFSNGELAANSPSDALFQDLETLASLLGAEVVLEDEVAMVHSAATSNAGREIVLFWPVLIIVLFALLVWRW